jgi:hypothetical protein
VNNHLHNAGSVTQINERNSPVVPAAVNPASQRYGFANIFYPERTGVVSTEQGISFILCDDGIVCSSPYNT